MKIDRIGIVDPLQNGKKADRIENVRRKADTDSVSFSSEAVEKGDLYQAVELVSAAPDVRIDRIEELKRKINDPSYINDAIIGSTAERIMDAFGI
jgi:negative regulator of flagellin synthesis FlgM